ncbi:cysteine proteinase inhibitor 1-like [Pyrus ussuriensis x Pyrus communis]|uniref:Cysteine proteinase inhibitor 1-like n=1 Tax=Pyrus ussuriensis x Pyrus communis TaxID=2448454 RepID=A0A5N5HSI1_9ROSA|nr:cysteine proteinase inhibitor 1-like [Pyrus ussuriensis x Pyrus communis]KAB2630077.1 cysteine proteinase inhibitor 1-like [Pyrus ussuriensis x Pyrus communis]
MRPHCFLALLTLLTLLAAVPATKKIGPPWKEIKDLKDPYVISIAEWGVSEYNKNVTGTNKLVFQSVTWGVSAFISGTFYGLVIAAKNESLTIPPEEYKLSVWDRFLTRRFRGLIKGHYV